MRCCRSVLQDKPLCSFMQSELISSKGYPSEEHKVVTEDGYILGIYRIPHGIKSHGSSVSKPVVFLQHGLLGDGSHWVSNLANNSLGFILADAGYDVWIGNSRGNIWSRNHQTLSEQQEEFWAFSFDDMAKYDLPAVVNFILQETKQQQLYYIGHSQGTAIGFIAFSTMPELAKKIKMFFALAPVTRIKYAKSPIIRLLRFPEMLLSIHHCNLFKGYDWGDEARNKEKHNQSEIIHYHGYPSEEYQVETEDNYILSINRIPHGRYNGANKGPRPVVFLQHAVLADASHWVSNMPNNSFGFILADAGYDVWLGNSRGNTWSVHHKTLKSSEQKFWEFSFHEMGYYDVPAVLYFILNKTEQPQLYYVGHSQGSAIGFIAFSSWPKLAQKIKVFFCMGPVTTLTYATTPPIKILSYMPKILFHALFGSKQVFQSPTILRTVFAKFCKYLPKLCINLMDVITGSNTPNFNMVLETKQFQAYDHGSPEKNMEKYNQITPPVYKIEDIKIPIEIWSGGQDLFASVKDIEILCSRISNLIHKKHIPEWQHIDFTWGLDATEHMYLRMIETMKKYSHCQYVKLEDLDKRGDWHSNHSFYEKFPTPVNATLKCYCH
ncbi:hypothetical protein lerEdw1_009082 [Lerista edwardsae]|nr:hypothetical protein lerEdw1_009082 [Lerista edwardsae]